MSPVEFDCMELRKAIQVCYFIFKIIKKSLRFKKIKGLGTDDSALIELITSRSNKRLKDMAQLYQQCKIL